MSTADVDEVCATLRGVLAQTRGLDRRDFVRALTGLATTAAGSVLFAMLANIGRSQAEQPVTYFGYGGAWKAAITQAFFDPFTRKTGILDERLARLMPSHPENEKLAHTIDYRWWADNNVRLQRRFEQWLQS